MSLLQQAIQINTELENLIKQNQYGENVRNLVQQNKANTFQFSYLSQPADQVNIEELKVARQFCELNVFYSLGAKNIEEYESASVRLRVFYENYPQLPASSEQSQFVSLYLLYLLSFNKLPEFHTQLELLPIEDLSNKYIKFILDLERSITVGNYQEVLNSKQNIVLPQFSLFLDRIIDTIRYEVARSAEQSYKQLKVQEAVKLFNLSSADELQKFVQSQSEIAQDNGFEWKLVNDTISFFNLKKDVSKFDTEKIIVKTLQYANELDKII